jgi:hypothetical protein
MTDRDYQHSRILDVHRWSEHQEANLFVDEVYDTFLNRQGTREYPHQEEASEGHTAGPLCCLAE